MKSLLTNKFQALSSSTFGSFLFNYPPKFYTNTPPAVNDKKQETKSTAKKFWHFEPQDFALSEEDTHRINFAPTAKDFLFSILTILILGGGVVLLCVIFILDIVDSYTKLQNPAQLVIIPALELKLKIVYGILKIVLVSVVAMVAQGMIHYVFYNRKKKK